LILALVFCTSAFAETYVIRVGKANIRHGPGEQFPVAWQVGKGFVLKKIAEEGEWLQVRDMEGDGGWVHVSVVRKRPVVVVTSETANIRVGPGTNHGLSFKAVQGVVLDYLDRTGDWLKVSYSGEGAGWIHQSLVWGAP